MTELARLEQDLLRPRPAQIAPGSPDERRWLAGLLEERALPVAARRRRLRALEAEAGARR